MEDYDIKAALTEHSAMRRRPFKKTPSKKTVITRRPLSVEIQRFVELSHHALLDDRDALRELQKRVSLKTVRKFKLGLVALPTASKLLAEFEEDFLVASGLFRSASLRELMWGGAFVIPNLRLGSAIGLNYRLRDVKLIEAYGKYQAMKGVKRALFNGDAIDCAAGHDLVIAEGAFDTMALEEHGFPTVGIPGQTFTAAYASSIAGGRPKSVYVILDNGEKGTDVAREKVERELGAKRVDTYQIELPAAHGDANDFFRAGGSASALRALMADSKSTGPAKLKPASRKRATVAGSHPAVLRSASPLHEDDDGYYNHKARRLSNWTASPVERLTDLDGNEVLRLELRLVGSSSTRDWRLKRDDLISKTTLTAALPSFDFTWWGTNDNVQDLREHWRRTSVPIVKSTSVLGRQGNMIVLPTGTFDAGGEIKNPPIVYDNSDHPPLAAALTVNWGTLAEADEAKRVVLSWFPKLNAVEVVWILAGWIGSLPWVAPIRKTEARWGGFPHVYLAGTTGAGKTTTGNLIRRMAGVDAEPDSLPKTPFTRLIGYTSSNLLPVMFDEYRPGSLSSSELLGIHKELRSLYRGEHTHRGLASLKVRSYWLQSPVLLVGEAHPTDSALMERGLLVNPKPATIDAGGDYRTALDQMSDAPLDVFALRYWAWSTAQSTWLEKLEESRREVVKLLDKRRLPERAVNNLAIIHFGVRQMEAFLGGAFLWVGGTSNEALLAQADALFPSGRKGVPLDELVRLCAAYSGHMRPAHHWKVVKPKTGGGKLVVLKLDRVVEDVRRHCKASGTPVHVLPVRSYVDQAKELADEPDSYVVDNSYPARFSEGTLKGVALRIDDVEHALGVDAATWECSSVLGDEDEDEDEDEDADE